MKNKGFTLIEILGIIVVLSVIAIVTIPMINNITSKTKKDAFRASVLSIFSAADYQVFNKDLTQILKVPEMKLDNNNFISGTATLINRNWVVENVGDGNYCANGTLTDLKIENGECDPSIPSCFFIVNSEQNEKGWYTEEIKLLMKTSTAEASGIEYGIGSTETYDHKIKRGQYGTIDITVSDTEEVEYICYVKTGKNNKSTNKIKLKVDTKKPTTPVITGGSEEWSNSYIEIKVSEESKSTSGIEKYMYHISETEEIKENGEWKDVEGLSVKIAKEGKYYVYFKSINNAGVESEVSNYQIIKIDRNAPEIESTQNKREVTINFKANVNLLGYQVTRTNEEPTSWIDITGLSTIVTYQAESAGTHYIYAKDESGIISSYTFDMPISAFNYEATKNTYEAKPTCASGYTYNNGTCDISYTNNAAMCGYQCSSGTLSGSVCLVPYTYNCGTYSCNCRKKDFWYCNDQGYDSNGKWVCKGSYSKGSRTECDSCPKTCTGNNQVAATAKSCTKSDSTKIIYVCPENNATLSGTTCTYYTCPDGGTLSGTTCIR